MIWHNGRVESVVRIATDITHRKIADQQLKRERQLLRRLLDLQERERQIVAYDIHDGLVQYLTGGLMHLEAFAAAHGEPGLKAQADYERGTSLLRDALAEPAASLVVCVRRFSMSRASSPRWSIW